jgi:hypothetical protein
MRTDGFIDCAESSCTAESFPAHARECTAIDSATSILTYIRSCVKKSLFFELREQ